MVTRVRPLPSVVGRHDGPDDLWDAPCVCAAAAVHRGVFRVYRADSVLFARGKSCLSLRPIVIAFRVRVCCSRDREWVGGETDLEGISADHLVFTI